MLFSDRAKLAFFLPNSFTALNMGCGFMAILLSIKGAAIADPVLAGEEFWKACMFMVLAAIFDSVDGRVARMTNTQSSFGEQFDSLSDLISFGVAPALVYYFRFLTDTGRAGMVAAFFFMLCGALRLARFNANIDKNKSDYFQGLPIPSGALAVLSMVLVSVTLPEISSYKVPLIVYLLFYAGLMVSSIPFPSFKKSEWVRKNKKSVFMLMLVVGFSVVLWEEVMLPALITFYVLASLVYFVTHRKKFEGIFDWSEEPEAEAEK